MDVLDTLIINLSCIMRIELKVASTELTSAILLQAGGGPEGISRFHTGQATLLPSRAIGTLS